MAGRMDALVEAHRKVMKAESALLLAKRNVEDAKLSLFELILESKQTWLLKLDMQFIHREVTDYKNSVDD